MVKLNSSLRKPVTPPLCYQDNSEVRNIFECFITTYYNGFLIVRASVYDNKCIPCTESRIQTHRILILPVVLYVCEIWYLALKHRLKTLQNRMLGMYLYPRSSKHMNIISYCILGSFMIPTPYQAQLRYKIRSVTRIGGKIKA